MLQGINQKPSQATMDMHSFLLNGLQSGAVVSQTEIDTLQEKTYRQLRLRELLLEHSTSSSLVVMSLPMPRQVNILCN